MLVERCPACNKEVPFEEIWPGTYHPIYRCSNCESDSVMFCRDEDGFWWFGYQGSNVPYEFRCRNNVYEGT